MTISQIIEQLTRAQDEHGDVYVEMSNGHLVASVEPIRQEGKGEVIAVRIK